MEWSSDYLTANYSTLFGSRWVRRHAENNLESRLGHLQLAVTVVQPGHTCVHHPIELEAAFRHGDHWICLNMSTRFDIEWKLTFIEEWNGVSLMSNAIPLPTLMHLDRGGVVSGGNLNGSSGHGSPVVNCIKGASPKHLCIGGVGEAVGRKASLSDQFRARKRQGLYAHPAQLIFCACQFAGPCSC